MGSCASVSSVAVEKTHIKNRSTLHQNVLSADPSVEGEAVQNLEIGVIKLDRIIQKGAKLTSETSTKTVDIKVGGPLESKEVRAQRKRFDFTQAIDQPRNKGIIEGYIIPTDGISKHVPHLNKVEDSSIFKRRINEKRKKEDSLQQKESRGRKIM